VRAGLSELGKSLSDIRESIAALRESIGDLEGSQRTLLWVLSGLGVFSVLAKVFHWG
jgi:hypothetical protein